MPAILAADQGGFCPAASDQEDLLLELALSVWLRTSELGLEEARGSLLALRRALLEAGSFDRRTEPVPLLSRDTRQALVDLARYLAELAERAATVTGRGAPDLVREALEQVRPVVEPGPEDEEGGSGLAVILTLRP